MSIYYPLSLPDDNLVGARLDLRSVVGAHASEFTGSHEVQEHAGQWWEMSLDLLHRDRANIAAWQAFLLRLRGKRGTFVAGDPGGASPRGAASGDTPTVNGASQAGNDLATQGWTPSQTGLLLPGDYVQVCRNYVTAPNDLEDASWTLNQFTADNNSGATTDPLGTNTATALTPTVSATGCFARHEIPTPDYVPGFRFGALVWLKAATGTPTITLRLTCTTGGTAIASLTNQSVSSSVWTLFHIPATAAPAAADRVRLLLGADSSWPEADGVLYVWGASVYSPEYDARLHMVTSQFDSDSNGRGTLEVVPKLRTIDDHARIIYSSPVGLWRLADNRHGWSEAPPVRYTDMAVRAVEAL